MGAMLKFVIEHFSHVFPIVVSGAIGVIIICERSLALLMTYPMGSFENFFERVRILIMRDRIADAIALCESMHDKPVARVVRAGLNRSNQPEQLVEHALQIAVAEASDKINARTMFLGTIANVATLFGLLGTIIGLVQSFEAVGAASAAQRSAMLANGISTAMNATMLGLGVAIPCMIMFSFLSNRASKLVAQVDQSAVRTMDLLQQRYFLAGATSASQEPTFQNVVMPRKGA
jgi:biopolymer transport protein ExbB/TolQ